MATPSIALYNAPASGWGHRAAWALEEVEAKYETINIDFSAKPDYYFTKVNPSGLVPVLQVGESLDNSSKIPESAVIIEYIAETTGKLGSEDPLKRAHGRYFAERTTQLLWSQIARIAINKETSFGPKFLEGLVELQSHLTKNKGKFLVGDDITLGDISAGPFYARLFAFAEGGLLTAGGVGEALLNDAKFSGLRDYNAALLSRAGFTKTFPKELIVGNWTKRAAAAAATQK